MLWSEKREGQHYSCSRGGCSFRTAYLGHYVFATVPSECFTCLAFKTSPSRTGNLSPACQGVQKVCIILTKGPGPSRECCVCAMVLSVLRAALDPTVSGSEMEHRVFIYHTVLFIECSSEVSKSPFHSYSIEVPKKAEQALKGNVKHC